VTDRLGPPLHPVPGVQRTFRPGLERGRHSNPHTFDVNTLP